MWVNRRTGQTVSGSSTLGGGTPSLPNPSPSALLSTPQAQPQGGHWVHRQTGQIAPGRSRQGGISPTSILSKLGSLGSFGPSALASLGLGEAPTFAPGVTSTLGSIFSGEAPVSSLVGAGAETAAGSGLAGALSSVAAPLAAFGALFTLPFLMPHGESAKDLKIDSQLMHNALSNEVTPALRSGQPVPVDSLRMIGGIGPSGEGLEASAVEWIKAAQRIGIQPPRDAQGNYIIPSQRVHFVDVENPGFPNLEGKDFTTSLSLPAARFDLILQGEELGRTHTAFTRSQAEQPESHDSD